MTWEQAIAAVLAIAVTALARLVDYWLPPRAGGPSLRHPGQAPPHSGDIDWADDDDHHGPPYPL